jgi:hypothetical protein
VLTALLMAASILAGFGKGPWWAWIVGGSALALLGLTDPGNLTRRFSALGAGAALLADGLVRMSTGCLVSAGAFALGRMLWWALAA